MTAPARAAAAARALGAPALPDIAQEMLVQSYRDRPTARKLGRGLELRLSRINGQLVLAVTRPSSGSIPSDTELDIVLSAFGAGRATRERIAGGYVCRWRDDVCAQCGDKRLDPEGWGMISNAELCPACRPAAAAKLRAQLAEASVKQQSLF